MRLTSINTEPGTAPTRWLLRAIPWVVAASACWMGARIAMRGHSTGWVLIALSVLAFMPLGILTAILTAVRADRRVTIDSERREIEFENYPILQGFWPTGAPPKYVCRFDELAGVERSETRWGMGFLIVHVPAGRIRLNSYHTNYEMLSLTLQTIAGPRRVPLLRRQATLVGGAGLLVVLGVALAFAMGWLP